MISSSCTSVPELNILKRFALPACSTASGMTLSRVVRLSTDWLRPPKRLRRAAVMLPVAEATGVTRVVLPPLELTEAEGAAEVVALPTCNAHQSINQSTNRSINQFCILGANRGPTDSQTIQWVLKLTLVVFGVHNIKPLTCMHVHIATRLKLVAAAVSGACVPSQKSLAAHCGKAAYHKKYVPACECNHARVTENLELHSSATKESKKTHRRVV